MNMKSLLGIMTIIGVIIMSVFASQAISGKSVRKSELTTGVSNACNQVLRDVQAKKLDSNEQLSDMFVRNLKKEMKSKGNVKIKILTADAKHGLLDVIVSQEYQMNNNKKKTITVRKTAFLDQKKRG